MRREKLQPKGVLTGSRSMMEVQKTMARIYKDQNKNVVKYLSSYHKDENTLSKPLYMNIMDLIKNKKTPKPEIH